MSGLTSTESGPLFGLVSHVSRNNSSPVADLPTSLLNVGHSARVDLRVTRYDFLSAMLVAAVIVTGFLVFALFTVWLTLFDDRPGARVTHPVIPMDTVDTGGDAASKETWNTQGELDSQKSLQIANLIDALTNLPYTLIAAANALDGNSEGTGLSGDLRKPGPPGPGHNGIVPEWQRWQIQYAAKTRAEYLNQLDSMGIYLGAVRQNSNRIFFLHDPGNTGSRASAGDRSATEARQLYFRNTKNQLRKWEETRFRQAGIDLTNALVVQFYPDLVRQLLLQLEQQRMVDDGRNPGDVKQTLFRLRPRTRSGDVDGQRSDYEYYIEDIVYRAKQR